jgi:hypothetical protein
MKSNSGIYEYLDKSKVLEHGTAADIEAVKAQYRKAYKAKWRQAQRQRSEQFTVSFTEQEAQKIAAMAKKYKWSCTRFIRLACLAYSDKTFLVVDVLATQAIAQLLAMNYNELKQAFDSYKTPFEVGKALLAQMADIEQKVLHELYHPREAKDASHGD